MGNIKSSSSLKKKKGLFLSDTLTMDILQYHILSFLTIPEVVKFRGTSRKFRYFGDQNLRIRNLSEDFLDDYGPSETVLLTLLKLHEKEFSSERKSENLVKYISEKGYLRVYRKIRRNSCHRFTSVHFMSAMLLGHVNLCKEMVKKKFEVYELEEEDFVNMFTRICQRRDFRSFKFLLKVSKMDVTYDDDLFLRTACEFGAYEIVEFLLKEESVDPRARRNAPIGYSSQNGYLKIVKLLMRDKRVDPSDEQNYALRIAALRGYHKIVKVLMKDKKVDASDMSNFALRYANSRDQKKVVKLLLKNRKVLEVRRQTKNMMEIFS